MLQPCCLALHLARQTRGSASGSKLACMIWKVHIFVTVAMPFIYD